MPRFVLLAIACSTIFAQDVVRMNQIQIVGTHNSYHAGLSASEMSLLRKHNPKAAESLAYKHPPLEDQLNSGVRQLELDVYSDSKGGLFANPLYLQLAAKEGANDPFPAAWTETMKKPGFKTLHVADVDFRSHCATFVACLGTVRAWSKTHPGHLPIFILVETKTESSRPEFAQPEPITAKILDALDAEILSVFPKNEIVTPDDVRGKHETLESAVLQSGWPALDFARGKVVFLFDQERVTPLYLQGHPSLRGRVLFTNAKPGDPDAAFLKINNPASPEIPDLVRKGYLIRTMTDGGLESVRKGDTTRRDQALASGAQLLSTDYPLGWKAPSGFFVSLGQGMARCNPVNAPAFCSTSELSRE